MKLSQARLPAALEMTPSLGALLLKVISDPALDSVRRKQYAGAIRSMASILGRPAEAIRCDLFEIDRLICEVPRAVRRQSNKTVANVRCRIKAAMNHFSRSPAMPPRGLPLTEEWAKLDALLTERRMRIGLSRLIRMASHKQIDPKAVDDDLLQVFVADLRHVNWGPDVLRFWRRTVALWNEAARTIVGWPSTLLSPPPVSTRVAHLSLGELPSSFQADVKSYLAWAAGSDCLADDARERSLRPGTIRLQREQLRVAASTLSEVLGDPSEPASLAVLVKPSNVRLILNRYMSRSGGLPTAFIRGLAWLFVTVAVQRVKAPQEQIEELRRLKRRLGAEASGLTEKNRAVLRHIQDKRVLGGLLTLPDRLRAKLSVKPASRRRQLQQMQIALAIEILLVAPMRLQNLVSIRIDQQLQWPSGRDGPAIITLDRHETKNGEPLEYAIEGRSKALLEEYLDHYWHRFPKPALTSLFISAKGSQMKPDTLREGIIKAVRRELGIALTPHQFRHVAAAIALDARPGALGLVKDLLGHKSINTTIRFYAGTRTREAGREYDRILNAQRQEVT